MTKSQATKPTTDKSRAERIQKIIKGAKMRANKTVYAYVPIDLIEYDSSYQTKYRAKSKSKLAEEFSEYLFGEPLLSLRDGHLYAIDGRHRIVEMTRRGQTEVLCRIAQGLTRAMEADIFSKQQSATKALSTYDKFNSRVIAEEETATMTKKICTEYGYTISPTAADVTGPTIRSIGTLYRIMQPSKAMRDNGVSGEETLHWIFELINKANWRDSALVTNSSWLPALSRIYQDAKSGNLRDDADEHITAKQAERNILGKAKYFSPAQLEEFGKLSCANGVDKRTFVREMLSKVALNKVSNQDVANRLGVHLPEDKGSRKGRMTVAVVAHA